MTTGQCAWRAIHAGMVTERVGDLGIVDGFVRESVDELMLVARFRWVTSGDPSTVVPAVMAAAGLPHTPHRASGQ